MRDLERWKDQVELSLDGRQIFFLFFGSAVAACVIFLAGVLVGKRIGQPAVPAAAEDPLAVLDQIGAGDDEGLTFHAALARSDRRRRPESRAMVRREEPASAPAAVVAPSVPSPAPTPPGAASRPAGDRYTLQLSAFTDRTEAESFARRIQGAGYRPYIVQSEAPGRGSVYRVRVGEYGSKKAADDARGEIERKQHLLVYVARM